MCHIFVCLTVISCFILKFGPHVSPFALHSLLLCDFPPLCSPVTFLLIILCLLVSPLVIFVCFICMLFFLFWFLLYTSWFFWFYGFYIFQLPLNKACLLFRTLPSSWVSYFWVLTMFAKTWHCVSSKHLHALKMFNFMVGLLRFFLFKAMFQFFI